MKHKLAEQRKQENLQSPSENKKSNVEEILEFERIMNETDDDIKMNQEADKIKKTLEYFEQMKRPRKSIFSFPKNN